MSRRRPRNDRRITNGESIAAPAGEAASAPTDHPEPPEPDRLSGSRRLLMVAAGLLLLWFAGAFLAGPEAWGFNHLAYVPIWVVALWGVLAASLAVPAVRRSLQRLWSEAVPYAVFESRFGTLVLSVGLMVAFALLHSGTFFLGDGYLVAELVDRDEKFRGFDAMDYLIHFKLHQWLEGPTGISSFTLYQIVSVIAGGVAVLLIAALAKRLAWEAWRRLFVFALVFVSGVAILFCGYVESYTLLYIALTAFLFTCVLVLENRAPLWLAATFFGLGLFLHLTAVFSGAPLLYLALRGPTRPAIRRWLEAAGPPALLLGLAVLFHAAAGYDSAWFRKDFLESKNAQQLWIPLTGYAGFFSAYHWKDMLNLVLLTAPVASAVVLVRVRSVFEVRHDPRVQLLVLQVVVVALFGVFLDRKLGGARDWDLLSAHSAGILLLAGLVFDGRLPREAKRRESNRREPKRREPKRAEAFPLSPASAPVLIAVSMLLSAPWMAVQAGEARSIDRFQSVAEDFPSFQRAYAYEEVGKYYRKKDDYARALEYYQRCVEAFPSNARFHVLLGSVYLVRRRDESLDDETRQEYLESAEAHLRTAVEQRPEMALANRHLAHLLLSLEQFDEAYELYRKVVSKAENRPTLQDRKGFGMAALQSGRLEEARQAFERILRLDPNEQVRHQLGAAFMGLNQHGAAAAVFRDAVRRGEGNLSTQYGLAASLVAQANQQVLSGEAADPAVLNEAEVVIREILQADPGNAEARGLLSRLQGLRAASPR